MNRHVVAARDHADGLAGLEKFVDGGGGVFRGVGEDDVLILVAGEAGGQRLGVSEGVVVVHRVAADGGDALVGAGSATVTMSKPRVSLKEVMPSE